MFLVINEIQIKTTLRGPSYPSQNNQNQLNKWQRALARVGGRENLFIAGKSV